MTRSDGGASQLQSSAREKWDDLRRAFAEFLWLPTCMIVLLLLLAAGSHALDRAALGKSAAVAPVHAFLQSRVFADAQATTDLLSTIAASVITMASLTITLLLIVVQQTAASMTSQVFDQFLRRRHNQVYFGFFIGLALYALVILATVDAHFNPVFGATLALVLTVIALFLLLVLVYTTINQMRTAVIVEAIHDHILSARRSQRALLQGTRRASARHGQGAVVAPVKATRHGFVTHINLAPLKTVLTDVRSDVEIVLNVSIGSHVARGDVLAQVHAPARRISDAICDALRGVVHIEQQRDVQTDPAYGIEQLEMIAWTSISTSKSNPAPGVLTIRSLRDVLARWADEDNVPNPESLPIVYDDNVQRQLMDTFETLAVVSSESMQHQNFIEVVRTIATMFDRLRPEQQARAEDLVLRILSALGDHVLTSELDAALSYLAGVLDASARIQTANAVRAAQAQLRLSIGRLNSRSTRVSRP